MVGARSRGWLLDGSRVGVRGQVPAAQDSKGAPDDSTRTARSSSADRAPKARGTAGGHRPRIRQSKRGSDAGVETADQRAAARGGDSRTRTGDVAPVPPHPLVSAE